MRLHLVKRSMLGGRETGDVLVEAPDPVTAVKRAAEKYPGERLQYVTSMALDTPRIPFRRPRRTSAAA